MFAMPGSFLWDGRIDSTSWQSLTDGIGLPLGQYWPLLARIGSLLVWCPVLQGSVVDPALNSQLWNCSVLFCSVLVYMPGCPECSLLILPGILLGLVKLFIHSCSYTWFVGWVVLVRLLVLSLNLVADFLWVPYYSTLYSLWNWTS